MPRTVTQMQYIPKMMSSWPHRSLELMLVAADAREECNFMEKVVLASMKHDNPVYIIGNCSTRAEAIRCRCWGATCKIITPPG